MARRVVRALALLAVALGLPAVLDRWPERSPRLVAPPPAGPVRPTLREFRFARHDDATGARLLEVSGGSAVAAAGLGDAWELTSVAVDVPARVRADGRPQPGLRLRAPGGRLRQARDADGVHRLEVRLAGGVEVQSDDGTILRTREVRCTVATEPAPSSGSPLPGFGNLGRPRGTPEIEMPGPVVLEGPGLAGSAAGVRRGADGVLVLLPPARLTLAGDGSGASALAGLPGVGRSAAPRPDRALDVEAAGGFGLTTEGEARRVTASGGVVVVERAAGTGAGSAPGVILRADRCELRSVPGAAREGADRPMAISGFGADGAVVWASLDPQGAVGVFATAPAVVGVPGADGALALEARGGARLVLRAGATLEAGAAAGGVPAAPGGAAAWYAAAERIASRRERADGPTDLVLEGDAVLAALPEAAVAGVLAPFPVGAAVADLGRALAGRTMPDRDAPARARLLAPHLSAALAGVGTRSSLEWSAAGGVQVMTAEVGRPEAAASATSARGRFVAGLAGAREPAHVEATLEGEARFALCVPPGARGAARATGDGGPRLLEIRAPGIEGRLALIASEDGVTTVLATPRAGIRDFRPGAGWQADPALTPAVDLPPVATVEADAIRLAAAGRPLVVGHVASDGHVRVAVPTRDAAGQPAGVAEAHGDHIEWRREAGPHGPVEVTQWNGFPSARVPGGGWLDPGTDAPWRLPGRAGEWWNLVAPDLEIRRRLRTAPDGRSLLDGVEVEAGKGFRLEVEAAPGAGGATLEARACTLRFADAGGVVRLRDGAARGPVRYRATTPAGGVAAEIEAADARVSVADDPGGAIERWAFAGSPVRASVRSGAALALFDTTVRVPIGGPPPWLHAQAPKVEWIRPHQPAPGDDRPGRLRLHGGAVVNATLPAGAAAGGSPVPMAELVADEVEAWLDGTAAAGAHAGTVFARGGVRIQQFTPMGDRRFACTAPACAATGGPTGGRVRFEPPFRAEGLVAGDTFALLGTAAGAGRARAPREVPVSIESADAVECERTGPPEAPVTEIRAARLYVREGGPAGGGRRLRLDGGVRLEGAPDGTLGIRPLGPASAVLPVGAAEWAAYEKAVAALGGAPPRAGGKSPP